MKKFEVLEPKIKHRIEEKQGMKEQVEGFLSNLRKPQDFGLEKPKENINILEHDGEEEIKRLKLLVEEIKIFKKRLAEKRAKERENFEVLNFDYY